MHLYKFEKFSKFRNNLTKKISAISCQNRQHRLDILLVVVLASVAGLVCYQGAQLINPALITTWEGMDVWFDADITRVFFNMISRWSDHYRTKVHPLFSLIAFPPVYLLSRAGLEEITAVRIVIAAVSSLWISAVFVLLRLLGCRRFDATLFSILAATSAAAMFWFVIPETYSFGSLSLLLALCLVAIAQYRKPSSLWYMVVSALTLSVTTTNWMAGILATIANHPWKRALQITANAFCLVVVLWAVQKRIFPSAVFFLGDREEEKYINMATSGGPLQIIKSFVSHTMVMPTINIVDKHSPSHWPLIFTQSSPPGSASLWGTVAVVLWTALLGLGLWGFFSIKQHLKLRIVLGLTLLGQLALHLVYGSETFLYALHFVPLLIVLAAFSTLTRARPLALVLAGALALSAGVNNGLQFDKVIKVVENHAPGRHQVLRQMQLRPTDQWPRGTGHVVLAAPGSPEIDKAYHEPGGSFSPAVGS